MGYENLGEIEKTSRLISMNRLVFRLFNLISMLFNFNVLINRDDNKFLIKLPEIIHFWEINNLDVYDLKRLINSNSIVIDVGAHKGIYSIIASKNARIVYSFEPVEENLRYFRINLRMNNVSNVVIFPFALWSKPGYVEIKTCFNKGLSSVKSYLTNITRKTSNIAKCLTLDEFTKTISKHSRKGYRVLVKIDAEGSEYEILKGSKKFIDTFRPYFVIEIHSPILYKKVVSFFKNVGYNVTNQSYLLNFFGKRILYLTVIYAKPKKIG